MAQENHFESELNGVAKVPDNQTSDIRDVFIRSVRPLLDVIDDIRSLGIEQEIEIPQIAVIGDQSSGKSSVLEALSGVKFPHSLGLSTRCAIQVRMKRSLTGRWRGHAQVSWDSEQPKGAGEIRSPEDVKDVITILTEALTSHSDGNFSPHSIIIEIESPNAPDLTIVDLPGIIRTTVQGQSATNIERVERLVQKFAKQERTVILAVVPANQDIATIDALERAQKCDPTGDRTIAVVTKMDLVDKEAYSNVRSLIRNEIKPIKMGYCAVKNRSSKDTQEEMSIAEAKREEKKFFASHPAFSQLDDSLYGIESLTSRLVQILVRRIEDSLPRMKEELSKCLTSTKEEITELGDGPPSNHDDRCSVYEKLVTEVYNAFYEASKGDFDLPIFYHRSDTILLYNSVDKIFQELESNIGRRPGISDTNYKEKLQQKIKTYRNKRSTPFLTPKPVFKMEVCNFIKDWPKHSSIACDKVVLACNNAIDAIVGTVLSSFPNFKAVVTESLRELIDKFSEKAREMLKSLIHYEQDPFTRDRHFNHLLFSRMRNEDPSGDGNAENKLFKRFNTRSSVKSEETRAESEHLDTRTSLKSDEALAETLMEQLETYWTVSKKRYLDYACLILRSEIVDATANNLLVALISITHKKDILEQLFAEDPRIQRRRNELNEKKRRLDSALHKISSVLLEC